MPYKTINDNNRAVEILQALAHELRLQICVLLSEGSLSVSTICQQLNTPQHRVSQQLALLRGAGIVAAEKQSRQVFYSIKDDQAKQIINLMIANKGAADEALGEVKTAPSATPENKKPTGVKRGGQSFEAGRFSEII